MRFLFSFLPKDILARMRGPVSFVRFVRWGLVAIAVFSCTAIILDIFIFYRYSYRVVNLNPEPVVENARIDRAGLREALEVLDARAEKFRALFGGGTTTLR